MVKTLLRGIKSKALERIFKMFLAKKLKKILFGFMLCVLLLGICEGVAQILNRLKFKDAYDYRYLNLDSLIFAEGWHDRFIPSPYFGYVCDPNAKDSGFNGTCNNHGFSEIKNFPYVKSKPNEIVVGIFGGSIAENLGKYILRNQDKHALQIQNMFGHKPVTFINFGLGGYKAQQSFNVLSYYLDSLDYVVFVDGQNELTQWPHPLYPHDFPFLTQKYFNQSTFLNIAIRTTSLLRRLQNSLLNNLNTFGLLKSSALYFTVLEGVSLLKNKLSLSIVNFQKYDQKDHLNTLTLLNRWKNTIKSSHILVTGTGKKYFHFLQPSPHSSILKPMSKEEQMITMTGPFQPKEYWRSEEIKARDDFYRSHVQSEKITAHSLTSTFDHESRAVYVDDCCHVNSLGNELLFSAILNVIGETKLIK